MFFIQVSYVEAQKHRIIVSSVLLIFAKYSFILFVLRLIFKYSALIYLFDFSLNWNYGGLTTFAQEICQTTIFL